MGIDSPVLMGLVITLTVLSIVSLTLTIISIYSRKKAERGSDKLDISSIVGETVRDENDRQFSAFTERLDAASASIRKESSEQASQLRSELSKNISEQNRETEQKFENIRRTMSESIKEMREDNNVKLEQMRTTVDEKLQKTLEERLGQSFKLVSERLEEVHRGLGDMKNLASGVGDLKRVLSNVKTRGILGEIQLGAILTEILAPEQYAENISTVPGSSERVEYAISLPGADEDGQVWLPIDAKYPGDAYAALLAAYETGDKSEVDKYGKALDSVLKSMAKDIRDKYVEPPATTDFAIMFLPIEGLYAEAVQRGMIEELQRLYKVNIAGPTTMAALLNSLQMGFKTLAIQKRGSEVWQVLAGVKEEFEKFGAALGSAQKRIRQADEELDKLINTRSNVMRRKLRDISAIETGASATIGEDADELPGLLIEYGDEE